MDTTKQIELTKEGLATLKKELDELVNLKRPKVVERLSNARTQGDLTENSDYAAAKEELEFLDGRIEELGEVLKKAVVVKSHHNGAVAIGTRVRLRANGQTHLYFIVGEWEADPKEKKISHTSPLGQALIGKQVGDKVEVEAPAGKVVYEILSVE